MKRIKVIALKPYLLIFFCISIVVILSSFKLGSFKANAYKKQIESQVKTSLKELEMTQAQELGPGIIQVIIKNGYQKDITAIVASSEGKFFRRDYIFAELEKDQKLSPGASDEFLYNLEPGENAVITAVLFADMSSAGNRSDIQNIIDRRLGMKTQLSRINPYLEQLNQVDRPLIQTELQKLKLAAGNLRIEKDDKSPMSEDFEYGLRDGRAFFLRNIPEIEAQLTNDRPTSYFQDQQLVNTPQDGYENFRKRVGKVNSYCKSLELRL